MGKEGFKKWGWVALYSLLIFYSAVVAFIGAKKGESLGAGWLLSSGIAGALGAFLAFWRGVAAHERQTGLLESQNGLVNRIWELLSKEDRAIQPSVFYSQIRCQAYVMVILYAMYQSFKRKPFNYKVIDSDNPDLVKLLIFAIKYACNSNDLLCDIGDDDCLVVTNFNPKALTVISGGRELVNRYSHYTMGLFVKKSVHEINIACGIKENYSSN